MAFKLPRLTTDIDCEPIGYPGLVVRFWLNPRPDELVEWTSPWEHIEDQEEQNKERERILEEQPWERPFYHIIAQIMERVTVPAKFTDTGGIEVWEITDAKAFYDLENAPGFDQSIIIWAQARLQRQRQARLQDEAKN